MFKCKYLKIILLILLVFNFCLIVKAADLQVPIPGQPDAGRDLASYISGWYTFGMGAIGVVAVIMIMWGGMQWMTATGNAALIGQAKQRIYNAIIGVILALCSYGLLYLINPALVELKMPYMPFTKKEAIREYNALSLIGKDCVKNQDCQGSAINPVYDLMCYVGCPGSPVGKDHRKCLPILDARKACDPAYFCAKFKEICYFDSEDVHGNCCDSRLVCKQTLDTAGICKEREATGSW